MPEQFSAVKPDIRNDIYALGSVLLSMNIRYGGALRRCLQPIDSRIKDVAELKKTIRRRRKTLFLVSGKAAPMAYVCGKKSGVCFEKIN